MTKLKEHSKENWLGQCCPLHKFEQISLVGIIYFGVFGNVSSHCYPLLSMVFKNMRDQLTLRRYQSDELGTTPVIVVVARLLYLFEKKRNIKETN